MPQFSHHTSSSPSQVPKYKNIGREINVLKKESWVKGENNEAGALGDLDPQNWTSVCGTTAATHPPSVTLPNALPRFSSRHAGVEGLI